jgi:hypothetical protein
MKKKIFWFGINTKYYENDKYIIRSFDPLKYFQKSKRNIIDFISFGINGYNKQESLKYANLIHKLYINKDQDYYNLLEDFKNEFIDYDILIFAQYNFIHPDFLDKYFSKTVKIIGLIDDPEASYSRTIPYLWSFDAAFHISNSYLHGEDLRSKIQKWGVSQVYFKHLTSEKYTKEDFLPFKDRQKKVLYVGGYYGQKLERLMKVKSILKSNFLIFGRWPFYGLMGFLKALTIKKIFPYKIKSLSKDEKSFITRNSLIGFNLEHSIENYENGNARNFEVTAYGALLITPRTTALNFPFIDGIDCIMYDDIDDAISKIKKYLIDIDSAEKIAKSGYEKYWTYFNYNLINDSFLDWAISVTSKNK